LSGQKYSVSETLLIFCTKNKHFLHATAATAVARFSHHNSVPSVCLSNMSVTWVDQSKMLQARITKFSPLAAWKTLVPETVKLFHKFEKGFL